MSPWDQLLDWLAKIVSPDWDALVALLPLAAAGLVALYFLVLAWRASLVGPRQRVPAPEPLAPTGVHLPGPSAAPILASVGAFSLFLTLVLLTFGPQTGPDGLPVPGSNAFRIADVTVGRFVIPGWLFLVAGVTAMVLALGFWLRVANHDYRAVEQAPALPAVAGREPPPGVHVPGPSFRPLLVSIGAAVMLLGLVIDPILLLAGTVMVVVAMVGWLRDAAVDYRLAVRADATGHLENPPAPRFPVGTFLVFAVLFAGALLIATGIFPPRGGETAGGGGSPPPASVAPGGGGGSPAPGTPAPSGAPGTPAPSGAPGTPAPSGAPGSPASPGQPAVTLKLSAQGIAYDTDTLTAPAGAPFAIEFANDDAGIPHNVEIRDASGARVFFDTPFSGIETRTYQVPALPAGDYQFVCTVHPTMVGTLTVK